MVAVLMVLTSHEDMGNTGKKTGWYLPELAHPYHVFKTAGYNMTFVSPKGGKAPLDPSSLEAFKNDTICQDFLADKEAMNLVDNTNAITSIKAADYDVVFCVGGHGPMFDLPNNDDVNKAIATIYEKGGIAAAVCHGPAGIVNTKLSNGDYLIKGKKVTGFTNAEEEAVKLVEAMPFLLETKLKENGAQFEKAPNMFEVCVCASDRVVTGQNPASATPMAEKIVELLKQK
ncbi:hypothetical protein ABFA07_018743 [Porites harrisoni]